MNPAPSLGSRRRSTRRGLEWRPTLRGLSTGRKLGAAALVIWAIALTWGMLALRADDDNLRKSGEPARAQVLRVHPAGRSLVLHDADVRFRTNDGAIVIGSVEVQDAFGRVRSGDTVDIRYDRQHPSKRAVLARINQASYWRNAIVPFFAAVVMPLAIAALVVCVRPKAAGRILE